MADPVPNKITISSGIAWTDGKDTIKDIVSFTVNQVLGGGVIFQTQNIDFAAPEALILGDVAPGYITFRNLDATNFVKIGNDASISQVVTKLLPGQGVTIPTDPTTQWFAQADTASVKLLVLAVDGATNAP